MGYWTHSNPVLNNSLATDVGLIQSNFTFIQGVLGSSTLSAGITWAQGGMPYATAVQTLATLAKSTDSCMLTNYGATNNPSWVKITNMTHTGTFSGVGLITGGVISGTFTGIISSTAKMFGTWSAVTSNTSLLAATDGIVMGYGTNMLSTAIKTDSANPPTTIRKLVYNGVGTEDSLECPVKKGDYYMFSAANAVPTAVYWLPIGF